MHAGTSDVLPVNLGFDENTFGQHKITNLVMAGPRLGYAWDRLLVFTTGGWTWANIENTHCSSITGICGGIGPGNGVSSSNNGWYAGGGFDYVVHKGALVDMIFGVEYQHFDLNGARAFCVRPGCAPPAVRDFDLSATAYSNVMPTTPANEDHVSRSRIGDLLSRCTPHIFAGPALLQRRQVGLI